MLYFNENFGNRFLLLIIYNILDNNNRTKNNHQKKFELEINNLEDVKEIFVYKIDFIEMKFAICVYVVPYSKLSNT